MKKLSKNHKFATYTIWLREAVLAEASGNFEEADSHYWMAAQCARRLGLDAPLSVAFGAEREQRKIDDEKAAA